MSEFIPTIESAPVSSKWEWTAMKYQAAADIADGRLSNRDIAKRAHISERQLHNWRCQPAFAALVEAILHDVQKAFPGEIVVTKIGRIRELVTTYNKLLAIEEARAKRYKQERGWAAGESTGLIVTKETWGKTNSQEAAIDTSLIKAKLDLQERIARELGQWETSISIRHSGRVDHVHRSVKHEQLTDEQLEALEAIALDIQAKEHAVEA